MEHSILPPSSAARRVACPGSRALEARYPELEPSPSAAEGDAAHWVASRILQNKLVVVGDVHHGELITDEMVDGAELFKNDVGLSGHKNLEGLVIEERIEIPTHLEAWGTPDAWTFALDVRNDVRTIWIWDYKFGHGFVDAHENWQLIAYAAGILHRLDCMNHANTMVRMRIVQPRCYHRDGPIREWSINAAELQTYIDRLSFADHVSMKPAAPTKPGSHCTYCQARRGCETLQREALQAVDISMMNTPLDLPSDALGAELRYLKRAALLLDARINGLSEEALTLLKRGDRVPHFQIEKTAGREYWTKPLAEVEALGDLCGVPVIKPSLITPNQARKAGIPEDVVATYSTRSAGNLKLAECDDKEAQKIFKNTIDWVVNN